MKLKTIFIAWWLFCIIAPLIVWHYDFQYDAGGFEGSFWFITFFVGFPFGIAGEFVGVIFENFSELTQGIMTYVLGSLIILLCYLLTSRLVAWLRRVS